MADIDPTLVEQILHIAERQWEPHIHHHRQADDLGRRLEIAKRADRAHVRTLRNRPRPLKPGFL